MPFLSSFLSFLLHPALFFPVSHKSFFVDAFVIFWTLIAFANKSEIGSRIAQQCISTKFEHLVKKTQRDKLNTRL